MEDYPLVTIGILSYNRPDDLKQAILSVINQTYTNLEILISDNGSLIEDAREEIRKFAEKDKRVTYFFHEINKGPMFNFSFLINNAKGKYFAWLADDDRFSPDFVSDCIGYFAKEKNIVLASNMPVIASSNLPIEMKYLPDTTGLKKLEKYKLIVNHIFSDLNLFYYGLMETASLKRCRYYLKKTFASDSLLLLELVNSGDFIINSKKAGLVYQTHVNQTSNSLLLYKKIVCINSRFIERRFFFTSYLFYMIRIVLKYRHVSFWNKLTIIKKIISHYISSKRFHLIKYDLGINGVITYFKYRLFKKNITKKIK